MEIVGLMDNLRTGHHWSTTEGTWTRRQPEHLHKKERAAEDGTLTREISEDNANPRQPTSDSSPVQATIEVHKEPGAPWNDGGRPRRTCNDYLERQHPATGPHAPDRHTRPGPVGGRTQHT